MTRAPGRLLAFFLLAAFQTSAQGQTKWTVDPASSLAWWQITPHMDHLWATTCPQEPSWRPGDGRATNWFMTNALRAQTAADTNHIPLYPRYAARDVCTPAVTGEITTRDTVNWTGVRGHVVVRAERLQTGQEQRDTYTRQSVLETQKYPEIRFAIDSLAGGVQQGDTLHTSVIGVLSLRGVDHPMVVAVRMWPEAGGLRVVGKFRVTAPDLVDRFGLSSKALGLGVGVRVWHYLHMGVDLVMRAQPEVDG